MDQVNNTPCLLAQIADVGDLMIDAAQQGDLGRLAELTARREALVAGVAADEDGVRADPSWRTYAEVIESQYRLFSRAISDLESRLQTELGDASRFRAASNSYATGEKRRQILHDDVRG